MEVSAAEYTWPQHVTTKRCTTDLPLCALCWYDNTGRCQQQSTPDHSRLQLEDYRLTFVCPASLWQHREVLDAEYTWPQHVTIVRRTDLPLCALCRYDNTGRCRRQSTPDHSRSSHAAGGTPAQGWRCRNTQRCLSPHPRHNTDVCSHQPTGLHRQTQGISSSYKILDTQHTLPDSTCTYLDTHTTINPFHPTQFWLKFRTLLPKALP